MRTAGTGKSYLIKTIREQLCKMAGKKRNPILVIVSTGVVAFSINGTTIHLTLLIPILKKKLMI